MPIDETGDIPDRDEVNPELDEGLSQQRRNAVLADQILSQGGVAHVYLPYTEEGEDIHCKAFDTHVFVDQGLLYTMVGDDEMWIPAENIVNFERHYDD